MGIAWLDRTRRPSAGRVLAVVSVLPALVVAGWLLAALPLLLAGWYRPMPALVLGAVVIGGLCWFALRRSLKVVEGATGRQVGAVVAVAVGSGVFNAIMHSEQLIVRRDPATYAQYATWLAGHGSLPIPAQAEAFGGADPALMFESVGFYDVDGSVVPQFMPGPPLLFAVGDWLGGLLLTPAVLGVLAVLTLAGVVGRLVGGRWAPVAALAFAVSLPILYTSRTTFSEIPSLILLFGGLALVHDALSRGSVQRWEGALAGLVFGLAVLVRIDGLRDVLPVLAFAGALIAWRRLGSPQGALGPPLLLGLAVGAGLGLLAAYVLARPYLSYLSRSVNPLLLICAAVLLLTLAGTLAAPRLARIRIPRWLPDVGAGLVVLVMVGLAVRPWLQTVRRVATTSEDVLTAKFIEQTQKANGMPVDGTRLYTELSLHWVSWYVGLPVIVLATIAAAVLVRGLLRNGSPAEWLLPLAVIGWTTVTTLLRPEITPDQPWAARRLVPVVIPGLILLAVWGLEWVRNQAILRKYGRWITAVGTVLILVPPVITSIGIAFTPVGRGERAAVEAMCAKIPPNASVLIVERVTGNRFTQLVRGMCGRPAAQVRAVSNPDTADEADVRRMIARVRAAGRVPVVLAAEEGQVAAYGPKTQVMALVTRQDERSLVDAPNGTWSLRINVWMAVG
ncbi:glycosyltransferase family 39 protein [Nonomuraea guangzhouensis]|uniref:Glycosyltransferase family 39 protein n=1 Tax=Nonomuraea guangzhouensis TaxID=1291555 RepID=A0ABW4GH79_9ACTN|nr:glycosyltransferase family 39 protein [Nonomuraea guangzhouensis]